MDRVSQPLISIVIPSLNQAPFLVETLESLVAQTYGCKELIVIDGGSTDRSVEIIRGFELHLAWWESEKDRGQSHAINKGFARATGSIVGWLNSDDTLAPDALANVAAAFETHQDVDLVYGDFVFTDAQGRVVRRRHVFDHMSFETLLCHDYLGQPAVFFRRSLLEAVGPIDESLDFCMDWDLFLRMWPRCHSLHLRRVLATYRLHLAAKSNAEDSEAAAAAWRAVQRRHMRPRFAWPPLDRAWYGAHFYWSFVLRAWTVIRDNPFNYLKMMMRMFPNGRFFRLLRRRLRSPF